MLEIVKCKMSVSLQAYALDDLLLSVLSSDGTKQVDGASDTEVCGACHVYTEITFLHSKPG